MLIATRGASYKLRLLILHDAMSRKRTSTECSNAVAGSSGLGQSEGNAKRKKLASLNDTTLHDLPMELIECILVKVVAMEVQAMGLSKCVWREKVDLVVNRLRTVCSQWCSILATKFFRNEVHRALDATAQTTVCLEILRQRQIKLSVIQLTTMNDELFMLFRLHDEKQSHAINVYGYNMAMVRDVIPLSETCPRQMVACSVSNCVYLLYVETNADGLSVQRVAKDKRQFKVSPLIKNPRLPTSDIGPMSLSPSGNLLILARQPSPKPSVVGIYDANGSVQHKIRLSPAAYGFSHVGRVIQKSDGNLVLDFTNDQHEEKLLEIDLTGRSIREYRSPLNSGGICCLADIGGRILIKYAQCKFELLDSEFNLLDIKIPPLDKGQVIPYHMEYNRERHELVGTHHNPSTGTSVLLVFRFKEE